jgi:BASS family bile acid:Na+ symporter
MTAPTTQPPDGVRLAAFVQRHFLWLLLACYALAAYWPQPGLAMRDWRWPVAWAGNGNVTFPLLLLALMLFCAAITTDLEQIRSVLRYPIVLCLGVAAVWCGPALFVVASGWLLPQLFDDPAITDLLVGLALVATMPVANSSVGWVQNADGNLALGLALVVLSISLSPWATPISLAWIGKSLSPAEQRSCEALVTQFSGWFFVVWVILPTALGFVCRILATPRRVAAVSRWIMLASASALLMLNYINSSLALPSARNTSIALFLVTVVLATALCSVGLILGWCIARTLRSTHETQTALLFGLSMKHTGLALILAGAVLADQPLAILLIVLVTLVQHVLAAVVQWVRVHRTEWAAIPSPP